MFIIGSKADVGVYLSTFFLKNNIRTFKYDFKITNKRYLKKEIREIKKEIIKIKPDYIFYLSSPKIIHDHIYSKKLFYLFDLVYCVFFKSILDILKKSNLRSKVFFPSSLFVKKSEDKNYLKSYVKAKKKAEMICKKHPYKKLVSVYRLPQFKTKSNYNILGYYEGTELNRISKYLSKFFS